MDLLQIVVAVERNLADGIQRLALQIADHARLVVERFHCFFAYLRRMGQNAFDQKLPGIVNGGGADIGLPGGIGAAAEADAVGILD